MSNRLILNCTIPSLSQLKPVATNTYNFLVKFFNASGEPLNNSNIPNEYLATVTTLTNSFQISVPITNGAYTISNVTAKLYADDDDTCCFASLPGFTITNVGGGDPNPGTSSMEFFTIYFADNGTNQDLRLQGYDTAPYQVEIKDLNNVVIHSQSYPSDDILLPSSVKTAVLATGAYFKMTDSAGKTKTYKKDKTTLKHMVPYYYGFSHTNGNPRNHIDWIPNAVSRNQNLVGLIFTAADYTDADFDFMRNNKFVPTPGATSWQIPFDEVFQKYKEAGVGFRLGVHLAVDNNKMYNPTTRAHFPKEEDIFKRVDGVTPLHIPGEVVPRQQIPCLSSPNMLNFAKYVYEALFFRYMDFLNKEDGFWIATGPLFTYSAEAELEFTEASSSGEKTGEPRGDFNPFSVAKFKQEYPQFANVDNNNLMINYGQNNPVGLAWAKFNSDSIPRFEHALWNHLLTVFNGVLTRTNFSQIDSGSHLDGLAWRRGTYNLFERIHPTTFIIKANDEARNVELVTNELYAASCIASAISYLEPSPAAMNNGNPGDPGVRADVLYMINEGKIARNATSFFISDGGFQDYILTQTGVRAYKSPPYVNVFEIVNGQKKTVKHSFNLTDLMSGGANAYNTSYQARKTEKGVDHLFTRVIDNLKPAI